MIRTIRRNMLKKEMGTKNFADTWRKYQKDKYGGKYNLICLPNKCYRQLETKEE